jgi:hypothetical protein
MAKTVYTGPEVPHIFATRPDAVARNANRTLSCEGGVLRSYAAPIAAWHAGKVLISTERHSVTTSKHQSWARYAVRHLESVCLPDLRDVLGNRGHRESLAAYIVKRAKEIEALKEKAGRVRSEWRKAGLAAEIAQLENACAYVWREIAGQKTPWESAIAADKKARENAAKARYARARADLESGLENARRIWESALARHESDANCVLHGFYILENAQRDIARLDSMGAAKGLGLGSTATFTDAARLMGKTWAKDCTALAVAILEFADALQPRIDRARAEFEVARRLENAERIAEWIAGARVAYPQGLPVACRVVGGDTVETSRGARVPLADALRLAGLAKDCRERGLSLSLRGVTVGQYQGTSISRDGTLTVGCHSIPWESIADAMARYEGAGT